MHWIFFLKSRASNSLSAEQRQKHANEMNRGGNGGQLQAAWHLGEPFGQESDGHTVCSITRSICTVPPGTLCTRLGPWETHLKDPRASRAPFVSYSIPVPLPKWVFSSRPRALGAVHLHTRFPSLPQPGARLAAGAARRSARLPDFPSLFEQTPGATRAALARL